MIKRFVKIFLYWIKRILPHKKIIVDMDVTKARSILEQYYCNVPTTLKNTERDLQAKNDKYDLCVIIPCFNVEKYVEKCIDSIQTQSTKYSIHIILIDDGSTDSTVIKLRKYETYNNFSVIYSENKGPSSARNLGLDVVDSNYILFVDSDDYLCKGSIDSMLDKAYEYDAEVVEGGMYRNINGNLSVMHRYSKIKKVSALERLTGFCAGKLWKSSIWKDVRFPIGHWFEDSIYTLYLYPKIKNAIVIPQMLYVYRQVQGSANHNFYFKPKSVDTYYISEFLINSFLNENRPYGQEYISVCFKQVIVNTRRLTKAPREIQESVLVLTKKTINDVVGNKKIPSKYKSLYKSIIKGDLYLCRLFSITH